MRPNPPQTSPGRLRTSIGQCSNHKHESDTKKKDPPKSFPGRWFSCVAAKKYSATDHFGLRAPKDLFWGGVWAKLHIALKKQIPSNRLCPTVTVFLALQSLVQF